MFGCVAYTGFRVHEVETQNIFRLRCLLPRAIGNTSEKKALRVVTSSSFSFLASSADLLIAGN